MILKLDTHVHSEKSFDCLQSLEEIAKACKGSGVHGAVICDHDIARTKFEIIDGILILPGIEISTELGHLLGLLINEKVEPTRDFKVALNRIHAAGGLAVLAHPFENRHLTNEFINTRIDNLADMLDGIECANGRAPLFVERANEYAYAAAKRLGLAQFGGSDAHTHIEIGRTYTQIEIDSENIENITFEDLKKAFKTGSSVAVCEKTPPKSSLVKSQFIRHIKNRSSLKKWIKHIAMIVRLYTVGASKK